ncbi:unnamed protein product [Pleuronectes platessa]|uniref:Uncharacterized protein n=1 Tax=Pleuronectes platessa TaxID=8262 RepID=A0A9N7VBR1_PLEPL|nr:unnamed protein product [Pleuronectes platessa]
MPEYWEAGLCRPDVAAELLTAAHMVQFNPEQAPSRVPHPAGPQRSWSFSASRLQADLASLQLCRENISHHLNSFTSPHSDVKEPLQLLNHIYRGRPSLVATRGSTHSSTLSSSLSSTLTSTLSSSLSSTLSLSPQLLLTLHRYLLLSFKPTAGPTCVVSTEGPMRLSQTFPKAKHRAQYRRLQHRPQQWKSNTTETGNVCSLVCIELHFTSNCPRYVFDCVWYSCLVWGGEMMSMRGLYKQDGDGVFQSTDGGEPAVLQIQTTNPHLPNEGVCRSRADGGSGLLEQQRTHQSVVLSHSFDPGPLKALTETMGWEEVGSLNRDSCSFPTPAAYERPPPPPPPDGVPQAIPPLGGNVEVDDSDNIKHGGGGGGSDDVRKRLSSEERWSDS